MTIPDLNDFFQPQGVALIGASTKVGSPNYQTLKNSLDMSLNGKVFPVNPMAEEILGLPVHRSVVGIPDRVDLVIMAVASGNALQVAKEIRERRLKRGDAGAVVIVTAGFKEMGTSEAVRLQDTVIGTMTEVGVRVIGPNCQGIADFYNGVNTSFSLPPVTSKGGLSIVSQSGAFATSCLRWASELGLLGLNKFVTLGNMADVDVTEVLAFLGQDEKTKSIAMYLEGTTRARALIETASEVTRKKPITVIKAGKSDVGSRVALSHTASVAGDDIIYDGAFRQAGVIRADSVAEFYHTSRVFDKLPVPKGDRVCLLTVVGGPSTICVDTLIATGQARLANFSQEFKEKARKILIASANVGNPDGYIDMTASVTPIMHEQIINLIMEEEGIDALLFLTTPPKFLKDREQAESILAGYNSVPEDKRKPMLTVLMAGTDVGECWKLLEAGGLPAMDMPDVAAKVMANMVGYGRYLRRAEFR